MSLQQLTPTAKAFIGHSYIAQPCKKQTIIELFNSGLSFHEISKVLDTTQHLVSKQIKELCEQGKLKKRQRPPFHHSAINKAKAVHMLNNGHTQKQAASWISKKTGVKTNQALISKWRHQPPVKQALAKLEAAQQTNQTKH